MNRMSVVLGLVIAIALIAIPSIAQPPDTLWTQTFGGVGHDHAHVSLQTSDGGFVFTGSTSTFGAGSYDAWLTKTDSDGNEMWSQTYGGTAWDNGWSVEQTSDGGYIITGNTFSFGAGQSDVWLIKTDSSGNELWSQTIGGTVSEVGTCVQQTSDGGYIITGYTNSFSAGDNDVWLIKTDSNGNTVWAQTFGGIEHDEGDSVQQASDGGYIVAGSTQSIGLGDKDVWLIKTDSAGNELWNQTFGGTDMDWGKCVQQAGDGGYIIAGFTASFGAGSNDAWLIKTDSEGNEIWSSTYGGTGDDSSVDVHLTSDNGFIIAGTVSSFGAGAADAWLIRLDSDAPQLNVTLTPSNPPIQMPPSGGTFDYNALVHNPTDFPVTFDAWTEVDLTNGNTYGPVLLRQNLTLPAGGQIDVTLTQNIPGFLIAGEYTYRGCVGAYPDEILSSSEFTFEKLAPGARSGINNWDISGWDFGDQGEPIVSVPEGYAFTSVYPNPFNPMTTVSLTLPMESKLNVRVFNTVGQEVAVLGDGPFAAGQHLFTFDGSDISSGIYFVLATVPGAFSEMQKIVLLK